MDVLAALFPSCATSTMLICIRTHKITRSLTHFDVTVARSFSQAVDMMNEATGFMTETLNDVVSVEKIEEGDLELQLAPSDIRTIIQTVQLSMKGSLAAKNLSLICTLEDSVPRVVKADGFRLEHVLANFVSNAVKFSPKNSSIYLSVKNLNPKKRHEITFSVRDEGVGISEEHQKSLFTPYMQVQCSAKYGCG